MFSGVEPVKTFVRWLLVALLVVYTVIDEPTAEDPDVEGQGNNADEGREGGELQIRDLRPAKIAPGGVIVVTTGERDKKDPIRATIGGRPAQLLYVKNDQSAFMVPSETRIGSQSVEIFSGSRKARPKSLEVRPVKRRKILRNVIGGLALVIFGLQILSRGLRRRAGEGLRSALGRVTRGTGRSLGLGVLAGMLTQTGASIAGLTVGSLQARLLGFTSAVAVVVGAQLGSALVGSLLPLGASRDALMLVALGVAWLALSKDQRRRSLAEIVLGLGLLFHGIQVLRVGFRPIVEDPEVLPYLHYLDAGSLQGILVCAALGVLLCVILQGPGAVFAVVLGVVQTTGMVGVQEGLAIMAGTAVGTAMTTTIVAWTSGPEARGLAAAHLVFSVASTTLVLLALPVWIDAVALFTDADPGAVAYGKKILYPHAGVFLVGSFILCQLVSTLALAPLVGILAARVQGKLRRDSTTAAGRPRFATGGVVAVGAKIDSEVRAAYLAVIDLQIEALEVVFELAKEGSRARASDASRGLASARECIDLLIQGLGSATDSGGWGRPLVAILHLHSAIEGALAAADRGVERGFKPEQVDLKALTALYELLNEGLVEIRDALVENDMDGLEMDSARSREIEINATEARHRKRVLESVGPQDVAARVLASELLGSFEAVGNHVYRLYESIIRFSE